MAIILKALISLCPLSLSNYPPRHLASIPDSIVLATAAFWGRGNHRRLLSGPVRSLHDRGHAPRSGYFAAQAKAPIDGGLGGGLPPGALVGTMTRWLC
ncbi:hypothetical protein MCOR15_003252 [Pyricularia oryzae]|nr:hypothetical protein MCOR15_003252 [Pyricularia oryzae]